MKILFFVSRQRDIAPVELARLCGDVGLAPFDLGSLGEDRGVPTKLVLVFDLIQLRDKDLEYFLRILKVL